VLQESPYRIHDLRDETTSWLRATNETRRLRTYVLDATYVCERNNTRDSVDFNDMDATIWTQTYAWADTGAVIEMVSSERLQQICSTSTYFIMVCINDKLWKQTRMPIKPMTRVGHDHTYGKCVTDCTGDLSCE